MRHSLPVHISRIRQRPRSCPFTARGLAEGDDPPGWAEEFATPCICLDAIDGVVELHGFGICGEELLVEEVRDGACAKYASEDEGRVEGLLCAAGGFF